MWKVVATFFGLISIILFTLSTGFFQNWSETGLINGSFSLGVGLCGALGAYLGRRGIGKTLLFSVVFAIGAVMLLIAFYAIVWPLL